MAPLCVPPVATRKLHMCPSVRTITSCRCEANGSAMQPTCALKSATCPGTCTRSNSPEQKTAISRMRKSASIDTDPCERQRHAQSCRTLLDLGLLRRLSHQSSICPW